MPRDENGHWMPEPHKADTYRQEQIAAGSKLATDFDKAASPGIPTLDAPKSRPVAAATTIQNVLTPNGTTRLQPNAQQFKRQQSASRMAERLQEEAARDGYRHAQAKQLTAEFAKAHNQEKAKDKDLER